MPGNRNYPSVCSRLSERETRPSSDEMREHLMDLAEMRASQQVRLYETAQQMREVFTEEQRQTFEILSHDERMRLVMSNMPMMDMMQMMQSFRGGQMGGGMMQGSMGPDMMQLHQHHNNR